ncbi:hypothetical protein GF319_15110 [Candidatus Bathyarchaeota archaeon]|nr:hypothetical protein [Candidatus Bathyarchaeota archaeon]
MDRFGWRVSNQYNLGVVCEVLLNKIKGDPVALAGVSTMRGGFLSGIYSLLSLGSSFNSFSQLPDITFSVNEQEISDLLKKLEKRVWALKIELGYVRFGERRTIDVEVEEI